MDYIDAIRLLAMQAVVREPSDYNMRYIFRWYSKEFATPLHVVESLPTEGILRHYFEVNYESLSPEDREEEIGRLTKSEVEVKSEVLKKDIEEAEDFEFARLTKAMEKEKKLSAQASFAEAAKKAQQSTQTLHKAMEDFRKNEEVDMISGQNFKEIKSLPPDITMSFIEPDEFEKLIEGGFADSDTE
jgi:superfamily II RNA helicase